MVTLYHFMRIWDIPDGSPFCVKLETYLRMAGIEYKADISFDIRKAPKGKMPLIKHKEKILADSSLIIDYLKSEFGDVLDGHLSEEEKAQSLCVQRLLEEHLYWAALYFRWVPDEAWQQIKPVFFREIPALLKIFIPEFIRKEMIRNLHGQGMSRFSKEEITQIAKNDLRAVSVLLGEKKYFFGDSPTTIDAVIFGFTSNILFCPIPSPIKEYTQTVTNLIDHCHRIKNEYFGDLIPQTAEMMKT